MTPLATIPEVRRQPGHTHTLTHRVAADDSAGFNFKRGGHSLDTHRGTADDSAGSNFPRGGDSLDIHALTHRVAADDSAGYALPR
jgi:hypothetical protein